jgi:methionyl aminopeptidase
MILLKTNKEIDVLKESGKILSKILNELKNLSKEGANLLYLNDYAKNAAKKAGAVPSFFGYSPDGASSPYPASICASLNDVVVHGVPFDYNLKSGDVFSVDMGINYKGFYTDAAFTVGIGKISSTASKLIKSTRKSLEEAVKEAKNGKFLGDIGYAIERRAKIDGFKVIKSLTGHGVGYEVHEDPIIFNFGEKNTGIKLKPGMVLAIEPMFGVSSGDIVQNRDESYSTRDGGLSAHFEHTIAITEKGAIVLTK